MNVIAETVAETEEHCTSAQRRLLGKTVSDYLLYFPSLAITALFGLVSVAVLSKIFQPAAYGHYSLALSTMLLLSMVTGLWLRSSVMRLLPQYAASQQLPEFFGTLIAAGLLVTGIVLGGYAVALPLFRQGMDDSLYRLLWLVPLGVPVLTLFTVIQEMHRINGRSAWYSGLVLVRVLGSFAIGLFLVIQLGLGPAGMILGMVGVLLAVVILHLLPAGASLVTQVRRLRWSTPIFQGMMAYTLPIVGLNLASTVLAISDRYLIEAYLSSYQLGIYAVSYSIAEGGMRLIANTFLVASEPVIFNSWVKNGPETTFALIERLFRYYFLLALPALVGLGLLREEVVTLFSTAEYAVGSSVVIFVGLALFFHGYSRIVGTVFDATKRTMIPFVTFVVAGLFNVGLNLVFLPRFGYQAAAWTTCASYALLLLLNMVAVRRIVNLRMFGPYLGKIALASAGMGAYLWWARTLLPATALGVILAMASAAGIYLLLALALGVIQPEERRGVLNRLSSRMKRGTA